MVHQCAAMRSSGSDAAAGRSSGSEVQTTQREDTPYKSAHAFWQHHVDQSRLSPREISQPEKVPGIVCGAAAGGQDLVGRQVAVTGSSQGRCIDVIAERTGATIGVKKLSNLNSYLAKTMEPQREVCQILQLETWIAQAKKPMENVTLAVSQDGVSLGTHRLETLRWRLSRH